MTIVREIADAVGMLAQIVDNTRSIVKAVDDGREYLARRYPDAAEEFAELLDQMQITVEGLAEATSVMSGFRFVVGSRSTAEKDLQSFRNYVIAQEAKVVSLRGQIRKLKADCDKIRGLRDDLEARRDDGTWSSMFGLLGMRKSARRDDLAGAISGFYADDQAMIYEVERLLDLSQRALAEVEEALGPPGHALAHNVPTAARMLGFYSQAFREPQQQLQQLLDALHQTAAELRTK